MPFETGARGVSAIASGSTGPCRLQAHRRSQFSPRAALVQYSTRLTWLEVVLDVPLSPSLPQRVSTADASTLATLHQAARRISKPPLGTCSWSCAPWRKEQQNHVPDYKTLSCSRFVVDWERVACATAC